ncbi:MAG TPA: hypothetical protein VI821_00100 [Candidatus Paceibacterota bacterium]
MQFEKATIYFKNTNSAANERMIVFLDENIEQLNVRGIVIDFKIVTKKIQSYLRQHNIAELPALFFQNAAFTGVEQIKTALLRVFVAPQARVPNAQRQNNKIDRFNDPNYNGVDLDDEIHDYIRSAVREGYADGKQISEDDDANTAEKRLRAGQMSFDKRRDVLKKYGWGYYSNPAAFEHANTNTPQNNFDQYPQTQAQIPGQVTIDDLYRQLPTNNDNDNYDDNMQTQIVQPPVNTANEQIPRYDNIARSSTKAPRPGRNRRSNKTNTTNPNNIEWTPPEATQGVNNLTEGLDPNDRDDNLMMRMFENNTVSTNI